MSDSKGSLDITQSDWIKDLDATRRPVGSPKALFLPEMDEALLHLRGGKYPVRWALICEAFAVRGWPCSADTLRRRLGELQGKE